MPKVQNIAQSGHTDYYYCAANCVRYFILRISSCSEDVHELDVCNLPSSLIKEAEKLAYNIELQIMQRKLLQVNTLLLLLLRI